MKKALSLLLLGVLTVAPVWAVSDAIPEPTPKTLIRVLHAAEDYEHNTGKQGSHGWELDYKRDKPGYALAKLKDPLILTPGAYRMSFTLRRGHYPNKGWFHTTYGLFRLELWDMY